MTSLEHRQKNNNKIKTILQRIETNYVFLFFYFILIIIIIIIIFESGRDKEENISFNNALNSFYLRLYGVWHVVTDDLDNKRGNPLPPLHGLHFHLPARVLLYYHSGVERCQKVGGTDT